MQSDADQPTSHRRVSVKEAALLLGITPEAVRARIKRGTLQKEKAKDGTVYVVLEGDQTRWDGDGTKDGTHAQALMVGRLENEIEFLRRELERKDAILLNMTEAMRAIPRLSGKAASHARCRTDNPCERAVSLIATSRNP